MKPSLRTAVAAAWLTVLSCVPYLNRKAAAQQDVDIYLLIDVSSSADGLSQRTHIVDNVLGRCQQQDRMTVIVFAGDAARITPHVFCRGDDRSRLMAVIRRLGLLGLTSDSNGVGIVASVPNDWRFHDGDQVGGEGLMSVFSSRIATNFDRALSVAQRMMTEGLGDRRNYVDRNPEHRGQLLVVVTDGMPDPNGRLSSIPSSETERNEWRRIVNQYGNIGSDLARYASITLPREREEVYEYQAITSVLVGTSLLCSDATPQNQEIGHNLEKAWRSGSREGAVVAFCDRPNAPVDQGEWSKALDGAFSRGRAYRTLGQGKLLSVHGGDFVTIQLSFDDSNYTSTVPLSAGDIEVTGSWPGEPPTIVEVVDSSVGPTRELRVAVTPRRGMIDTAVPETLTVRPRPQGHFRFEPVLVPVPNQDCLLVRPKVSYVRSVDPQAELQLKVTNWHAFPLIMRVRGTADSSVQLRSECYKIESAQNSGGNLIPKEQDVTIDLKVGHGHSTHEVDFEFLRSQNSAADNDCNLKKPEILHTRRITIHTARPTPFNMIFLLCLTIGSLSASGVALFQGPRRWSISSLAAAVLAAGMLVVFGIWPETGITVFDEGWGRGLGDALMLLGAVLLSLLGVALPYVPRFVWFVLRAVLKKIFGVPLPEYLRSLDL